MVGLCLGCLWFCGSIMWKKYFLNVDLWKKMQLVRYYSLELNRYVPKHTPVSEKDVKLLEEFIFNSTKLVLLTGAGISTESGIPDYRSEEVGLYARTNHKPIQHQEFLKSAHARQRFWARNYVGWNNFSIREPNSVHFAIANLEVNYRKVSCIITQNVDGLHFKAGSKNVIELHGAANRVICLECKAKYDRKYIQHTLRKLNSNMQEISDMVRPDGDAEIPLENIRGFNSPFCETCGGILKPDITFFGDNVPMERVIAAKNAITAGDGLLVLGSSLSVFSGYRIVLQALDENKKIAIVNIGPTRADKLVKFKISARCGDILPRIC